MDATHIEARDRKPHPYLKPSYELADADCDFNPIYQQAQNMEMQGVPAKRKQHVSYRGKNPFFALKK